MSPQDMHILGPFKGRYHGGVARGYEIPVEFAGRKSSVLDASHAILGLDEILATVRL